MTNYVGIVQYLSLSYHAVINTMWMNEWNEVPVAKWVVSRLFAGKQKQTSHEATTAYQNIANASQEP